MHFITMHVICTLEPLPQGYQYDLPVIDILMNQTWCILLHTKEIDGVVHTYSVHFYSKIGWSHKILSDNGTEFKNKLYEQVSSTFGMKQVFSPHLSLRQWVH